MRLSSRHLLTLAALLVAGALAGAQPPPPGAGPGPPPPKQNQPRSEGEDERRARPRAAATPLPMMDNLDMPEIATVAEEPVTASGNIDLWRARIAERRARNEEARPKNGGD